MALDTLTGGSSNISFDSTPNYTYTQTSVRTTETGYETSNVPNGSPLLINDANRGYLARGSYNVFTNGNLTTIVNLSGGSMNGLTKWDYTGYAPDRPLLQAPQVGWYIKGPYLQPGTKLTYVGTKMVHPKGFRRGEAREPYADPDYSGCWSIEWDLPALTTASQLNNSSALLFGNPNLYYVSPTPFTDQTTPTTSTATGVSLTQACNASASMGYDTSNAAFGWQFAKASFETSERVPSVTNPGSVPVPLFIQTNTSGYLFQGAYSVSNISSWGQNRLSQSPDYPLSNVPQVGWNLQGPFLQPGTVITSITPVMTSVNGMPVVDPNYAGVWAITWDKQSMDVSANINSTCALLDGSPNVYLVANGNSSIGGSTVTPTDSYSNTVSYLVASNYPMQPALILTVGNGQTGIPIPKTLNPTFESIQYGGSYSQAILPSQQQIATQLTQWTGNGSVIQDTLLRNANVNPQYWFVWAYAAPGGNQANYDDLMTFPNQPRYITTGSTMNTTLETSAINGAYANETVYIDQGIGVQIPVENPQYTMLVTPNILTIKKGYVMNAGSSTIQVTSKNPMFAIYGFHNGNGIYPKVGNKLTFNGSNGVCTIVNVIGHKTLDGWTASITVDIEFASTITATDQMYVYTWDPSGPPDYNAGPVVKDPPFAYMSLLVDDANPQYATTLTSIPNAFVPQWGGHRLGASGLFGQWDDREDTILPDNGWYVFGYDLDDTATTRGTSTAWAPQALIDYNATGTIMINNQLTDWSVQSPNNGPSPSENVNLSNPIGAHVDLNKNAIYVCPNTLTMKPGNYTKDTVTYTLESTSPLLTYLGTQDSTGDLPQAGGGFAHDSLSGPTTIISVGNFTRTDTGWTIDVTLADGATSDFTCITGLNDTVYTWVKPVKAIMGQQVNAGGTVVDEHKTSSVQGAPLLTGTVKQSSLSDIAKFYNDNYPDFGFDYQEGDTAGATVTTEVINKFLSDMGNCNFGWRGATALPSKVVFSANDTVVDMQFQVPQRLFQDRIGVVYYSDNNGTSANTFTVPPGCRFLYVVWLMGGGGAGGAADGGHDTGADWNNGMAFGGGSGAYVQNTWISVKHGDIITLYIGRGGTGTGGWGNDGEATDLKIYRPSDDKTYMAFSMGGGIGGNCNGGGEYSRDVNTSGIGGKVFKSVGNNNHAGNNSTRQGNGHGAYHTSNESDGRPGADSPLGGAGYGSGNATGYGAGGGGAGFHDGSHKHWSSGRAWGGSGAPGYGEISLTMYGPTDGSPVYDVCIPSNVI